MDKVEKSQKDTKKAKQRFDNLSKALRKNLQRRKISTNRTTS